MEQEASENAARVTELLAEVTVLPCASWMVTTGVPIELPAVPPTGWVENTRFVAAPAVILKDEEVAPVSDPEVAESVYPVPALSIESPEKVATPLTAFTVAVPLKVPDPAFVPMARVTELLAEVTVFPCASWMVTTGVPIELPAVPPVGWVENTRFVAAPAEMVTLPVLETSLPLIFAPRVTAPEVAAVKTPVYTPDPAEVADPNDPVPPVRLEVNSTAEIPEGLALP